MLIQITGDLHYRLDKPRCWRGDFQLAFERVMRSLMFVARNHHTHLWLDSGDVFHRPRPGLLTLSKMISYLNSKDHYARGNYIYCVAGNHDMPNHNKVYLGDSGLGVLLSSGFYKLVGSYPEVIEDMIHIYGATYGDPVPTAMERDRFNILIAHTMIYPTRREAKLAKFGSGMAARDYLKKHDSFDLIVTGHNHQHFMVASGNRCLMNPGCMLPQSASEADYRPMVYIYDTFDYGYNEVPLPFDKSDIDVSYLGKEEDPENELISFVRNLEAQEDFVLSFNKNVEKVADELKANHRVRKLIQGLIDAGE